MPKASDKGVALTVGRRIAMWRDKRGLTQKDLALKADLDPQTMSKIERGTGVMTDNLRKIAVALQVPTDALLFDPEEAPLDPESLPIALREAAEEMNATRTEVRELLMLHGLRGIDRDRYKKELATNRAAAKGKAVPDRALQEAETNAAAERQRLESEGYRVLKPKPRKGR
jgi:transcriptional regulator with XRE-family HTH domain